MGKWTVGLSLVTAAVAMAATFSSVTYAAFTSQAEIDQPIGVKRSLYLEVGSTDWNDGTSNYGVWAWEEGKSGAFAASETYMRSIPGTSTRFRITIPKDTAHVIFVKFSSGVTPAWGNMKKTENGNDKRAFQTVDVDVSSFWDTYIIGSLSGQYTEDGFQKWSGSTAKYY